MKKKLILSAFALVGFILVLQSKVIFAANGVTDTKTTVEKTVDPINVISNASHVANGIALRNKTSGWIPLRGVPDGSTVVKAFLYWNFSDTNATGLGSVVVFNGNRVNGIKRADSADPCWGLTGNHTYRANVTPFIPANNPNQDYEVVINFNGIISTTGQNPWAPTESQTKRLEGATLIVVYSNASTSGKQVRIYDALNGSEFSGSATFTLTHPALSGSGLFTMCGADGQRGSGHDTHANTSNEKTTFNGTQVAGTSVAGGDWDGSTGLPLPQLWDVHTHVVTFSGTSSIVVYTAKDPNAANLDCLVPVVFVLEK
ncbi:MAG: DUF3344 domain-containing protein [Candidatus Jettenia sp.]|uniref:DUF3344 domain-containing protein n=1 Tax=Candidatus Jettenia caeni TaxID=247490 RepID=I3IH65_9BACT|nr:DUF3344 domain-containing protein [Candidatus Jettenia sp. AMX1]MBC6930528.1 DUF3344 domain-containing protein [Candidatus Jettenia sp.]NUN23881.1 DUF3344 domain-containing protein [Candidatus Jettenia caeni]KAA0246785.1 MAG: DUF3344 domain-containing protein [Candidatus Jettenia sp. AMX1]MCE7882144.1 DUF3344 domain-containing protein [Candidatus Jettenia sp. AMX1]MCQ3928661.1 DUF3344 domain-containing protein [Candidatus Jettenia sp.]